ncbi:probable cytochrome P450 6a23 [Photinus pyralis]|uniref:probable cytochrome P450 6a23 n=1 Tax=Photinus pyralis TaxID=7054 RepID=UPI0012673F98|nr:probable cytochrome P450 6a23 [Photinus pyralis]
MALMLIILLVLLVYSLFFLRSAYSYWQKRGVYTFRPTPPFGNAIDLVLQKEAIGVNIQKFYQRCRKERIPFAGYYLLTKAIFVPIDVELIKRICTTDFDHFTDHIGHVDEKNDPLSTYLFNLKGDRWRTVRSLMSPSFSHGNVKRCCETVLKYAEQLKVLFGGMVGNLEGVNVKEACERYTTDVLISFTYGIEAGFLVDANSVFKKYVELVFGAGWKQSLRLMLNIIFPEMYSLLKLKVFDDDLARFFTDLVFQRGGGKIDDTRRDVLHNLTHAGSKNDLSMSEIVGQCFGLFLAGTETTSTVIAFTLFALASDEDAQEKARSEVVKALGKHQAITYEVLKGLDYTDNCISEAMRTFPLAPINTRICSKAYNVPNSSVTLEKGTNVFIPLQGVYMDPQYFPDPERYNPERFAEDNTENDTSVFSPFGLGKRQCIGYQLGILQIKAAIAVLLTNFRFTVHPDSQSPIRLNPISFIPLPVVPFKLNVHKL